MSANDDYHLVEKAIGFLDEHREEQPSLEQLATHVGYSPFHLQRVFRRWAGISPKRLLQLLTVEHAKGLLRESSVLDTALQVGLSGPSRLHDHFVTIEAMSPGEWKEMGAGLEIRWGAHETPFGPCLAAATPRGLCALRFLEGDVDTSLAELRSEWPQAALIEDTRFTADTIHAAFSREGDTKPLLLQLRGSNFQVRVWRALLEIPPRLAATYADVARRLGEPQAARAIGQAVGANPIAFLIPCHRVLRTGGALGGYRWGEERKRAILAWEASAGVASSPCGPG